MNLGDKINDISFHGTSGLVATLSHYHGKWLILYFYPKDATPGCTTESQDFRDAYSTFEKMNTTILGISRDHLPSHEKFKCAQKLPFELICDSEEILCQYFDVIKLKSMYGKQVLGIERSTFLIDPNGVLRHEWRKVRVQGHVLEVIHTLQALQNDPIT